MPPTGKSRPTKPAGPRPVTATYLRNAALHYVSQRAASVSMVRQILERRAKKRLAARTLDAPTEALIEAAIAELAALGLIDDARFAGGRAATLAGKGLARSRITQGLRSKGIARETIEAAVGDDIDDLEQARRFVARKRLGALRRGGMTPESRRKDLAALARAGFAYSVASRALDAPEET
jgi:regulatory protein